MTKWLKFDDDSKPDKKTKTILVGNVKTNEYLGTIDYYTPWRQYVFIPSTDTIWNVECLKELTDQISTLNNG